MMRFTRESKPNTINKVYRYFTEEKHAEQFLQGFFRISTLSRCRGYENTSQGDKHEGKLTYFSDPRPGELRDSDSIETARRLGIQLQTQSKHVSFSMCTRRIEVHNAYIFCTSTKFDPDYFKQDFGSYCVQIIDPGFFLHKTLEQIHKKTPIKSAGASHIEYNERTYQGLDQIPANGDAAFVKPKIYSGQNEYRFIFEPLDPKANIDYIDIECTKIRGLLTRLS